MARISRKNTSRKTTGKKTSKKAAPKRSTGSKKRASKSFGFHLKKAIGWPWVKNRRMQTFLRIGFLLALWGFIAAIAGIFILSMGLPDIRTAVDMDNRPTVIIRDRNGVEFSRLGDIQGELLTVQQMSPHIPNAVMAIEDRRFYSHWGIDPIGLLRAAYTNFRRGGVAQGGSTITQQLAKNLFLSPDRTMTRKAKEALLALYLERRYSKDEILAAYLNRAYFGAGAYGIDSASRVYFNTSARDVTLEQAAMLAGLLKAPSRYTPDKDPQVTLRRTRTVLRAMEDAGFVRKGVGEMAIQPLPKREYAAGGSFALRYYADWVMGQIESYVGPSTQNLIIDTTLDASIQKHASERMKAILDVHGKEKNITQGALIMMEPDGKVIAMVGGRDYGESQYNRAVRSSRQPGSSFKPFIYLAALEHGYTPQTMVLDEEIKIGSYAPTNFDGKYRGEIRLQDAVALSLNTVAVRVANDVGLRNIINMAQRLGITDPLTADLSLALGSSDVHLLSITTAYATLANRGLAVEPYAIRKITTTKGKVLYERRPTLPVAVLEPHIVAQINHMLQRVVLYGTGQRAILNRPVAGKTGTSSNYRDAWFIGYTAGYVMSVWVGNDDNSPMKRVTGGTVPAEIWRDVMGFAEQGKQVQALLSADDAPSTAQATDTHAVPTEPKPQGTSLFGQLLNRLLGDEAAGQKTDTNAPASQAPVRQGTGQEAAPPVSGNEIQWD